MLSDIYLILFLLSGTFSYLGVFWILSNDCEVYKAFYMVKIESVIFSYI